MRPRRRGCRPRAMRTLSSWTPTMRSAATSWRTRRAATRKADFAGCRPRPRRSRARRPWPCRSATPTADGRNGPPRSKPTTRRCRCRPHIPTRSSDAQSRSRSWVVPDAITTATTVIEGGQWMVGEAYYWRAWNQLRLGNLPMARREDADRALTQMANARVFVLSGVIEWRMRRLETAERDFQRAVTIDFGECEGAFDLGMVRDDCARCPSRLPPSGRRGSATTCRSSCGARRLRKSKPGPERLRRAPEMPRVTSARCASSKNAATRSSARSARLKRRRKGRTSRWRRARAGAG